MFGDLVRSMVMATDEAGEPLATTAYTAFGELVGGYSALEGRYSGYAGAWGYESGLLTLEGANDDLPAITLQHLGARWYQPGIGRFVQRDPIGLGGGVNCYAYVNVQPTSAVDPFGLQSLMSPQGLIVLIENAIVESGSVTVLWNGPRVVISRVIVHAGKATLIGVDSAGKAVQYIIPLTGKVCLDVTRTPSGIIVTTPKGGCGGTGLEMMPLVLYWLMRRRRQYAR